MADGNLAAVFKGLATSAEKAGSDIAKSVAGVIEKTADIEEANVARALQTEEQNAGNLTKITDPAIEGAPVKTVTTAAKRASFGTSTSTDYKATFFKANPGTKGKVVVHHAVEQQVLDRYPGVVSESQMHSLENLRGIPKGDINNRVHLSEIRKAWNQFYKNNPTATEQQLLDQATQIDNMFGNQFNPPVR